jgi:transcriptional regulator with XRE-family HTH domain
MDQRHIAAAIRAELGWQNLSQASLARALGWTEAFLSRRLIGEVPFTLADISAIADQLGVPPSKFLESTSPGAARRAG